MINIVVHQDTKPVRVSIEGIVFDITYWKDLADLIEYIMNKKEYSGERLCLEILQVNGSYITVDRWPL